MSRFSVFIWSFYGHILQIVAIDCIMIGDMIPYEHKMMPSRQSENESDGRSSMVTVRGAASKQKQQLVLQEMFLIIIKIAVTSLKGLY